MASGGVLCKWCGKEFLVQNRHINENFKLGHNFFCSLNCQSLFRNKKKVINCHRKGCSNKFSRIPAEISSHNFCSRSCSAIFFNLKRWSNQKLKVILTDQERANKRKQGSKLGGINRWLNYQSKYTKEYIIFSIKRFVKENGRIPVKRELNILYKNSRRLFGSWNNAIIAAGFKPNPVLFAEKQIAKDGHICDSIAEMLIDDYLSDKGFVHERNTPYPEGKYTADFKIGSILIEYFGLAGEHERYDQLRSIKKILVKKYNLNLIEIYPQDLLPKVKLEEILNIYSITQI
jgi:hypothetical protein